MDYTLKNKHLYDHTGKEHTLKHNAYNEIYSVNF